ncbi:hypothetical protein ACMYSO_02680 [Klebsiella sp. B345]|uniref:hypothetical protein n=1 Tax=Klebsiella sp. B345 TaxID=2755398 RepID=UPI003DA9E533
MNEISNMISKLFDSSGSIIKNAIQLIPVFIFLSCVLLWLHLKGIYRLDLFMPSMTNIANVVPVILSFFLYTIKLLIPSIPLLLVPFLFRKNTEKSNTQLPIRLALAILLALTFFAVSIPSIAFIFNMKGISPDYYMMTTLAMNIALTALIIKFIIGFSETLKSLALIVIICTSMKISFRTMQSLLEQIVGAQANTFIPITMLFVIYILCIFTPAITYIYSSIKNSHINIKLLSVAFMLLIVPMSLIKEVNAYAIEKTMISIGIADWCVNTYRVNGTKYSSEIFPAEHWNTKTIKDNSHFYISATAPFNLGDKVLLCPEYINTNYKSTILINFNENKEEKKVFMRLVRKQFQNCFIFNPLDINKSNTTFTNILDARQLPPVEKCI